ncbi:hypothetical protein [Sphingomonas sp. 28-62-11]|uniref:hypothetical protein n=1 Tax=Sphingomonas sp. 28-62-11 TaxID=1970432 RepID=UPI000BC698D3|nr:MAG: hypothetical protein B7Y49_00180 [Sphingomonas sp. 28-62-11]
MTDHPTQGTTPGSGPSTSAKGVLDSATHAASSAIETVVDTAQAAARRTAAGIDSNPLAVLAGGIAVGVLAGALLPRTDRETEMLGPVGKRLTESAAAAARAARDAGTAELMAAGISRDAARAQVGKLIDGVITAVKTAGDAATKANQPAPPKD